MSLKPPGRMKTRSPLMNDGLRVFCNHYLQRPLVSLSSTSIKKKDRTRTAEPACEADPDLDKKPANNKPAPALSVFPHRDFQHNPVHYRGDSVLNK